MITGIKPTDKIVLDLHLLHVDYNKEKIASLKHEVAQKYSVPLKNVVVNFVPITLNAEGERESVVADLISNIQNPAFHVKLFEDYIATNDIKDVDMDFIRSIDDKVNAYVDFDQYAKYKPYKIKNVRWSNFASYGPDNYFDFTKLHGLVHLTSIPGNQGGKTTFAIHLIKFALFGTSDKQKNLAGAFNSFLPEATEAFVEVCIEVEGKDYIIKRTLTRPALKKRTPKSKVTQKVEFYRVENGETVLEENCEGENAAQTNNLIRESIGRMEDFELVIAATVKSLDRLLDIGQTERSRIFSRWLGLLSIEEKENIAKDIWKKQVNPTLISNTYNKASLGDDVSVRRQEIDERKNAIANSRDEVQKSDERIASLEKEKSEVLSSRKQIVDTVNMDIETINIHIKDKEHDLAVQREDMTKRKEEYAEVKDAVFNEDDMKELEKQRSARIEARHTVELKNAELKTEIYGLNGERKKIQDLIAKGVCPECGQPVTEANQADAIDKVDKDKAEKIAEGVANKNEIERITTEIQEMDNRLAEMGVARGKQQRKQTLEMTMVAIKANIDKVKAELALLYQNKKSVEDNMEAIKANNEIDTKVRNIDVLLGNERTVKEQHIRNIQSNETAIATINKEIDKITETIKQIESEEPVIRMWNLYLEMIGKNGVSKLVLRNAIPIINKELDRLLDGICDFDVCLSMDEANNVNMNYVKGDVVMDLKTACSGFENTLSSLALRIALGSMGSMPKPSFIVLDEILSGINHENVDKIKELYKRILGGYDFILHIIHDDVYNDMHDMEVQVVKTNEISKVRLLP